MSDAIVACRKLVKLADPDEVSGVVEKIAVVEEKITRACTKIKTLYGLEVNARPAIRAQIKILERERERLRRINEFGNLPCLSFEPLTWRDQKGWPRLAILGLDSPRFVLSVVGRYKRNDFGTPRRIYRTVTTPKLPQLIQDCFKDVSDKLMEMAKEKKRSIHLATEYIGVIPDVTREKISEAKPMFRDIFLIAEARVWVLSETVIPRPRPRRSDPIVVGFDGANLWIIDSFDLTPVERYVKLEFSV